MKFHLEVDIIFEADTMDEARGKLAAWLLDPDLPVVEEGNLKLHPLLEVVTDG